MFRRIRLFRSRQRLTAERLELILLYVKEGKP